MFGYVHASNEPLPAIEPPLSSAAPINTEKPQNQIAMPALYDFTCIALAIVNVIALCAGCSVTSGNIPYRTPTDDEANG